MKRPSPLLLLLAVCCAAVLPACAQAPIPHAVRIGSIEELQAYFTYDPGRDIIVSGHRGGMMPGYPENCIESCEKTLSMMPTFFEVDFSFTRDSVMVLMHDLTIDRTTTGKGRVADYTYEELQQFCLVDRDRNVTPYKIPRLKDLLEWGKDKVVFNFDNKYINTRGVSDEVRRASLDYYIKQLQPGGDWSMYHNIMLSVRSIEEALYYWEHGIRNVMFCVEISSMEHFRAYDASPIPWKYIMAYIRLAVNPDRQPVYDLLHAEGVMTMTSITGSSDKVKNPYDRRVAYLRELVAEPDIIESYKLNFLRYFLSVSCEHLIYRHCYNIISRNYPVNFRILLNDLFCCPKSTLIIITTVHTLFFEIVFFTHIQITFVSSAPAGIPGRFFHTDNILAATLYQMLRCQISAFVVIRLNKCVLIKSVKLAVNKDDRYRTVLQHFPCLCTVRHHNDSICPELVEHLNVYSLLLFVSTRTAKKNPVSVLICRIFHRFRKLTKKRVFNIRHDHPDHLR